LARVVIDSFTPVKRKTVVGPIISTEPRRTAVMLSVVAPSPMNWRVEPHIVWSREREIEVEEDIKVVTGTVILAKHEGLSEILRKAKNTIFPSYHLAAWGMPVLTDPLSIDDPEPELRAALYDLGAWRLLEWAKKELISDLEVEIKLGPVEEG